MVYLYDASGSPIGMQYRTTSYEEGVFDTYWFEKNLQGDIIAVYNDAGTLLVKYTYDAWGNTVSTTYSNGGSGTIVRNNRFRYRGYYYDIETGFYYLNSRYYDPSTGRFINEDGQLNMDNLLGMNLYAYCGNNPVMCLDYLGDMWQFVPQLDPRNRCYGAGGSGFSGGSWDSSAYNTYQIRCRTQYYDAQLLGYYFEGSFNAGFGNISYYMVPGAVTVTDGVASVSSGSSMLQARPSNIVKYPGDDSTIAPGPDFEWRGKLPKGGDLGAWYNSKTTESFHPDFNHSGNIGPHYDYNYKGSGCDGWRIFPDGRIEPK